MSKIKARDSLIAGLINGGINYWIAVNHFDDKSVVPMSVDMISSSQSTVWGQAVSLTFGLGIILSLITSILLIKQLKKTLPQMASNFEGAYWWRIVPIALTQAAALFGWFVTLAVIWTKCFGVVNVDASTAAILVGGFAFIITIIVEVGTKKSILFKKINILELGKNNGRR
ncbi:permease [Vibrio rotiferianus]|uniref:permease n=1 Tax=Vibrio rotiferianus TaxID=190895 RepID=UPI00406A39E0